MRALLGSITLLTALSIGGSISGCPTSMGPTDTGEGADAPLSDAPVGLDTPAAMDAPRAIDGAIDAPPGECASHADCAIRARSCCGRCGGATADDWIALASRDVAAYGEAACAGGIGCPECAAPDDPYLVAWCDEGTCAGVNLAEDPITECSAPSDCVLAARRCCDCGLLGVDATIAYNPARGSPNDRLCDPDVVCPPCVPTFDSLAPGCSGGRCVVYGPD